MSLSQKQLNDPGGTCDFLLEKRESLAVDFPNLSQKQNLGQRQNKTTQKAGHHLNHGAAHSPHLSVTYRSSHHDNKNKCAF